MDGKARLLAFIQSERFTRLLPQLYGTDDQRDLHIERFTRLVKRHDHWCTDKTGLFSTAGRTELAGNHTDHNLGKVIAGTINLDTIAVATPLDEPVVSVYSEGFPPVIVDISDLSVRSDEMGTTDALVRGIAKGFSDRGLTVGGCIATTSTRVLKGSGLSSSAAIEVLVATLFNNLYNRNTLNPVELAMIGKYAENTYFGKPSGLMDQVACGNGGVTAIDFAHPERVKTVAIPCDFASMGYDLLVVDTQGDHANLTPDYAAIPKEMRSVAACFDRDILREVPFDLFMDSIQSVRKRVNNDRAVLRAYHYFTENQRVEAMVKALQQQDIDSYLSLVRKSGESSFQFLQNLYSPHHIETQGLPLALALTSQFLEDEGAWRVHGGGFAGTIQVYVPCDRTQAYTQFIENVFGEGSVTKLAIRSLPTTRLDDR